MTSATSTVWRRGGTFTGAAVLLHELPNGISCRPVNIVAEDGIATRALLYQPEGSAPTVGVHIMHPRTDMTQHYAVPGLVQAGYTVLARAGRAVNNDVDTVHEEILLDVAAGIRFLREHSGCDQVVLLGNSGGAPLAAFYQWQAELEPPNRLTTTAAGDLFDLNAHDLPPADLLALLAPHPGEGRLLMKWIDPSVVDETDAVAADPTLDMYDPRNGYRPPPESSRFSKQFLADYREGQRVRVRRLDVVARQRVESQRLARSTVHAGARFPERAAWAGWHMVIYRTAADPTFLDLTIEPDDRRPGAYQPDPYRQNYSSAGFARCLTPRAWLSTWSGLSSRVDTEEALANITRPLLLVHYAGDAGTRLAEVEAMFGRAKSIDKQVLTVRHAGHWGFRIDGRQDSDERTPEGVDAVVGWIAERDKS